MKLERNEMEMEHKQTKLITWNYSDFKYMISCRDLKKIFIKFTSPKIQYDIKCVLWKMILLLLSILLPQPARYLYYNHTRFLISIT